MILKFRPLERRLKILGYVCIGFGLLAALLCITPIKFAVFYAILAGFIGMVTSSIYVFIDTRNEINKKKFTPGVIGMILSSIPILFMLAIIVMTKMNH
ncbi:MAG: hypothetical protein K0Q95_2438 [Bacteroidota bacterium]|jgi:hypothetical protein|nr:hypothetical protein [Bacteroidota bacterium]